MSRGHRWGNGFAVVLALLLIVVTRPVLAAVLTVDTTWEGEVRLTEDLVVPAGITLTVAGGTRVVVEPAESSKTDPEYLFTGTELTVRGRLVIAGQERPVVFAAAGPPATDDGPAWAGIAAVDAGVVTGAGLTVSGGEHGIYVDGGRVTLQGVELAANRYGLAVVGEGSEVTVTGGRIRDNDYGVVELAGGKATLAQVAFANNRKEDRFTAEAPVALPESTPWPVPAKPLFRDYTDEALVGEVVWHDRVRVDGVVRLAPTGRLIILPGTVVEFTFRDTNGDGIGENGLLIQGQLLAKGTPQAPIFFQAAGDSHRPGLWDAINILGSDRAQNLLEYCRIRDAYRGGHFHFANVAVQASRFVGNLRGIQFQESLVSLEDCLFQANSSALRARDSQAVFRRNLVAANGSGANFYRMDVEVAANRFLANRYDGLRLREGAPRVHDNLVAANRYGVLVLGSFFGRLTDNLIAANLETGLALRDCDNLEVSANLVSANRRTGISLRRSRARIAGNLVAGNHERGIGVLGFTGVIEDNALAANGEYAIGLDGPGAVAAPNNWFGGDDPDKVIYDRADDAALGAVTVSVPADAPPTVRLAVAEPASDLVLAGRVEVTQPVRVAAGTTLTVAPATEVAFAPEAGLEVLGRIVARGTANRRIRFTAARGTTPSSWGEIWLDHAAGSGFSYCDFQYATWGLHLHFTPMTVDHCRFLDNDGGMRFRSGPYRIVANLFRNNRIGLRAFRATAEIRGNVFTANEIGIFVRQEAAGVTLTGNNLYNNARYNLRLGDFNTQDLAAATDNWWGTDEPATTIYDDRLEPGIGRVTFTPYRRQPWDLPEVAP